MKQLRRHFHQHRRKILLISPVIVFIFMGPSIAIDWFSDKRPTVTLEPTHIAVNPGDIFSVALSVASEQAINAFDVTVEFPTEQLDAIAASSTNDSIADLWVSKPTTHNASGTVTMIGGTTKQGGWRGNGELAQITFRARDSGVATLHLGSVLVLAHDGKGTDTGAQTVDAELIVQALTKTDASVISGSGGATYLIRSPIQPSTDLTGDGKTTIADLSAFMPHLSKPYMAQADFNQDGSVTIQDLSIMMGSVITK
jgi:hypothetical protein